jgi:Fe-S cluster biogenesis protein NfuA
MFIQTESTPNPSTLKFIPGKEVLGDRTMQFNTKDEASISPLATALFSIEGVKAVFLGADFISVTKEGTIAWDIIKTDILTTIMEHFTAGHPIIGGQDTDNKGMATGASDVGNEDDDEITAQIREIINTRVRPAVAQDGGDIVFKRFEDGIVYLEMHGACSGCPSATVTLKNGVENMLKHYVPEVERVESTLG